jgi:D-alanyl-D-alanine carboxypeptidase/D-alanyl-D-alanine-endopeptidase (penicillin-binding protein 4)
VLPLPIADGVCREAVAAEIRRHAARPLFAAARVGVFARQGDHVAVNLAGDRRFIPASLVKLATTAAAWRQLGPHYQIKTRVWGDRHPDTSGTVPRIWVEGQGDPQLTSADLLGLARQLRRRGVRRILASGLTTPLRGSGMAPSWEVGDVQAYYGAIAHGLTVDGNAILWNVRPGVLGQPLVWTWEQPADGWQVENLSRSVPKGEPDTLVVDRHPSQERMTLTGTLPVDRPPVLGGVAVPQPQETFRRHWHRALAQTYGAAPPGIDGGEPTPRNALVLLAEHNAPPLHSLIATTNQDSDNLHAELLLRHLGHHRDPQAPDHGTAGLAAVEQFWRSQGISPQQMHLADGSGLSRHNLITPRALVTILSRMQEDPSLRSTLAIAGQSGTLKTRSFTIPGRLQGKTGTASGISTLAGYVTPSEGQPEITFAIVVNHSSATTAQDRELIAAIVHQLSRLASPRCGNPK